ncbi:MAG: methionyl-tRNA formyltransferase [Lachnospiraceae bacterium]|nr:methionyl-tRNA formyltransferase [Lachnospiraceae bacterium]
MNIIYMGTPDFATGPLEAIIQAGYEVSAVVTQPDRPKGRSGKLIPSPVKEVALKYDIPVLQPVRLRNPESVEELKKYPADIIVVAAFGQILPRSVLDIPKFGCVNIHASLLPHLRGASPIQHAILQGDKESGVTIMQMDEGLDTGDILMSESIPIEDDDTGGSLFDKLAALGSGLIVKALPMIERGELKPIPQDEAKADHVGMLDKSMGKIDFSKAAAEIDRQVRAFDPWPGASCSLGGKQLKIWKVKAEEISDVPGCEKADEAFRGCIYAFDKNHIWVGCGQGLLRIDELQLEGKKRMSTRDFLLGQSVRCGESLNPESV